MFIFAPMYPLFINHSSMIVARNSALIFSVIPVSFASPSRPVMPILNTLHLR